MDIEQIREFALGLNAQVTEDLFCEDWITWRIAGKWFLLMQLDAVEPRVAVKLSPERGLELREHYDAVRPAYHMNKKHWSDLYIERLDENLTKELIAESYRLVVGKLPKNKINE